MARTKTNRNITQQFLVLVVTEILPISFVGVM